MDSCLLGRTIHGKRQVSNVTMWHCHSTCVQSPALTISFAASNLPLRAACRIIILPSGTTEHRWPRHLSQVACPVVLYWAFHNLCFPPPASRPPWCSVKCMRSLLSCCCLSSFYSFCDIRPQSSQKTPFPGSWCKQENMSGPFDEVQQAVVSTASLGLLLESLLFLWEARHFYYRWKVNF